MYLHIVEIKQGCQLSHFRGCVSPSHKLRTHNAVLLAITVRVEEQLEAKKYTYLGHLSLHCHIAFSIPAAAEGGSAKEPLPPVLAPLKYAEEHFEHGVLCHI